MSDLTSVCVCTYEKEHHLAKVFPAIAQHCRPPYEVVVVDDASKNQGVVAMLQHFQRQFESAGVSFRIHVNERNRGHAYSQNKAWELAAGGILVHLEDDIVVPHDGWNLAFADFFAQHPEVGQIVPEGSGRGEWIPRESAAGPYREFAWALGGFFAVTRSVYEAVGGWDEELVHQVEPDYNLSVRMTGWRLGEIPGIRMVHLGEGEQHETFRRQAQIVVGVHQMLGKWNTRFVGHWDYDSLWSMSWDDFPPNVAFRRQLAAWFAAQARKLEDRYRGLASLKDDPHYSGAVPEDVRKAHAEFSRCRINAAPEPFKYPGHWGAFELVKTIRPCGREREDELITLMKSNFVFGDVRRVENQLRDLAARMNYSLSDEELRTLGLKVPWRTQWRPVRRYFGVTETA